MSQKRREEVVVAPKFEDSKSPNFMYVYVNGVFGGLDPNGGRMIFFLDRLEPETLNQPTPGMQIIKKITRESQVEVHMSPSQFKSIATWMNLHIKAYEDAFGPIPMEPKSQQPPSSAMVR